MGAAGGDLNTYSLTYFLEDKPFNWNRILIEANPTHFSNLRTQPTRPEPLAFAVGAAVCKSEGVVHYIYTDDPVMQYISGIYEMMNDNFRKKFHRGVYDRVKREGPPSGWKSLPAGMIRIHCVPMSTVLKVAGVTHVNWFSLDTEGGELEVLRTIDWNITTFDVITVETEPWFRPSGFLEEVQALLESHGYIMMKKQFKRNSWFRHKSFQPTSLPAQRNVIVN